MNCPECTAPTSVHDSRPIGGGATVRRRRRCLNCGHRFSTIEVEGMSNNEDEQLALVLASFLMGKKVFREALEKLK